MRESGDFARRLMRVADDGGMVTEPVPIMEGEVIAEGIDSQLGATAAEHIGFTVRTIRDTCGALSSTRPVALFYSPKCGRRMSEPA
jgi:hypothetical protein